MSARVKTSLLEHLEGVSDPRIERTRRHKLLDILAIAICAMICGAEHQGKRIFQSYENAIHDQHLLMLASFASLPAPLRSDRERQSQNQPA